MLHDCVHCMMEWTKLWPFTVSVCLLCCIVSTHAGRVWRHSADNCLYLWTPRNSQAARTSRCCGQLPEKGETTANYTVYSLEFGEESNLAVVVVCLTTAKLDHSCGNLFVHGKKIVNLRIVEMLN